jgi:hypothetical protein
MGLSVVMKSAGRRPSPQLKPKDQVACPTIIGRGKAMLSKTVEAECQARLLATLPRFLRAITLTQTPASIADAPDPAATNVVTRATIPPTVFGAATAGRQGWANSIVMQ